MRRRLASKDIPELVAFLKKKPGDSVKVELKRGGDTRTVTVKLGQRPNQVAQ